MAVVAIGMNQVASGVAKPVGALGQKQVSDVAKVSGAFSQKQV
jgi:hypothetical protein